MRSAALLACLFGLAGCTAFGAAPDEMVADMKATQPPKPTPASEADADAGCGGRADATRVWPLDARESSCAIAGGITFGVTGHEACSKAASFEGSNGITCSAFNPTGAFAIDVWFRARTADRDTLRHVLVNADESRSGYALFVSDGDVGPRVVLELRDSSYICDAGGAVSLNTWTHVVASFNGSTLTVTTNGLTDQTPCARKPGRGDSLRIGQDFVGEIDDVAVFDRVF